MANDASNVRTAPTGAVMHGAYGATAPTGTGSSTTGFTDLGYVTEDGVAITVPGAGDSTPIKAWQGGAVVKTIRSSTEDNPTVEFTLMETTIAAVEAALGVTVTDGATEGSFEIDTTVLREASAWLVDVIDGDELFRVHVPKGTPVGEVEIVFRNDEPVGYSVSLDCERDTTAGYNLKTWSTALKTPA